MSWETKVTQGKYGLAQAVTDAAEASERRIEEAKHAEAEAKRRALADKVTAEFASNVKKIYDASPGADALNRAFKSKYDERGLAGCIARESIGNRLDGDTFGPSDVSDHRVGIDVDLRLSDLPADIRTAMEQAAGAQIEYFNLHAFASIQARAQYEVRQALAQQTDGARRQIVEWDKTSRDSLNQAGLKLETAIAEAKRDIEVLRIQALSGLDEHLTEQLRLLEQVTQSGLAQIKRATDLFVLEYGDGEQKSQ